ncbi:MAG: DUF2065 domain-containing protein [Deltaproteobacteria bacterium]|nr:DUF2065 domain-containing protein [Deltaproteobacteria bacterium]
MSFIFSVLGLMLIIEGFPYFAFPARVKEWALMIQEIPERGLRVMGFISMMGGLILEYVGRRVL